MKERVDLTRLENIESKLDKRALLFSGMIISVTPCVSVCSGLS